MERIWLKHYPPGVPAEIDPSRYPSLVAMLEESFAKFTRPQRPSSAWARRMTYAELDEASRAFAAWLQSKGLERGARVAIMMPNVLQYPVAIAGVLRAGYTVVNVNPLYTPRELEFQLNDSGAEAIIVLENFAARAAAGAAADPRQARRGRHHGRHARARSRARWSIPWCATSRRWCRPMRCPARRRSTTRSPPAAS